MISELKRIVDFSEKTGAQVAINKISETIESALTEHQVFMMIQEMMNTSKIPSRLPDGRSNPVYQSIKNWERSRQGSVNPKKIVEILKNLGIEKKFEIIFQDK